MKKFLLSAAAIAVVTIGNASAGLREDIAKDYGYLDNLYKHFHQNPELSFMEVKTAKRVAKELKSLGFKVTEKVGGTGVVAVMKNGAGPTLLMRADMDGLPVKEDTGFDFASTATGKNRFGETQPIMHACGHDLHMTTLIGTARRLAAMKDQWSGTLVMIGQPAEEIGSGATAMLKDGLYTRFPKPNFNVALHDAPSLPAGAVAYTSGYALANVDSVDIHVKGVGGHGAYPHTTKDPIVLGAHIVTALQTLVARETSPLESAVVTVGAFNAGYKHNIISDEAHLQLTVRSYTDEVRDHLLDGIKRIAKAQAISAGLPEELYPVVEMQDDYTPSTYNDPALTARVASVMAGRFGENRVIETDPVMGGEDFGQFGRTEDKIPGVIFWLGAVSQEKFAEAQEKGEALPSLHSPFWAPDYEPTLKTGVEAMSAIALDILQAE